jgi:DNA-directed RNA polymerase subunit RPC12/RpoP
MTSDTTTAKARCVHCREEVEVPDSYAAGDHIKCGSCGTKHKVVRGERLRLVLADVGPLRDALAQNQQLTTRLEAELAHARGSFGIGANGIGIGVAFAIYQVGIRGEPLSVSLLGNAVGIALVTGLLLEGANWAFLAKRHAITRLSAELEEARAEGARLRQLLRDSSRT